jgi:Ser/Thr protein kinase RdoA (MazF antagonist)
MAGERDEIPLGGGWTTAGAVRVGDTFRRPIGPNAEWVHRLLRFLEAARFPAAPRFVGFDAEGREILSYIEGDVPSDCRSTVWTDDQLAAAARLLRCFHDTTAHSDLVAGAEVACHNDFGPWNIVWRDGAPVALIDFDNAGPGARLDDLGYAVWKHVNLGLLPLEIHEQARRMRVMAEAYGVEVDSRLLDAVAEAQERMRRLIDAAPASSGRFAAAQQNRHELEWLRTNRMALIG